MRPSPSNVHPQFQKAVLKHQAGRLAEAERLYRTLLKSRGHDAEILHLLGIVSEQQGRSDDAASFILRAVAADPQPAYHGTLAPILGKLGRWAEAAASYQAMLNADPHNPKLFVLLGNTLQQAGRMDEAIAAFQHAARLKPDFQEAHNNLGIAFKAVNKLEESVASFRKAAACDGDAAIVLNNLGCTLLDQGQEEQAAEAYRRSIAANPDYADAYSNLGVVLARQKHCSEAVDAYRRAIVLRPDYVDAHRNLTGLLVALERPLEALPHCLKLVELEPDNATFMGYLGVLMGELGRHRDAVIACRKALQMDPTLLVAYATIIAAHSSLNEHDDALRLACHYVEHAPDDPDAYCAFAMALQYTGRWDDALAMCGKAIALAPDNPTLLHTMGRIAHAAGTMDAALDIYERAIALAPERAKLRWDQSLALLLAGRYREGWSAFEVRWDVNQLRVDNRNFTQPAWNGEDLAGKTILLHAEQGMGDTIQFIRYAAGVARRGGRVVAQVQPLLKRLVASAAGVDAVVAYKEPLPHFDVYCPMLSLPRIFETDLDTVPDAQGYLHPEPAARAQWLNRLGPRKGLRIGLIWAGNPTHRNDSNRSMRLEQFMPALTMPGLEWFSLQVGQAEADLRQLPAGMIRNLVPDIMDFADTAAALSTLDLLVTVDTSSAHLAGALGQNVWVMLPFAPDWRWMLGREDTPWYDSMRLFRQTELGNWAPVVDRLVRDLARVRDQALIPA